MKNNGFKNENKFIQSLNNKHFHELNSNLKKFIKQSFQKYEGRIQCSIKAGHNKGDIQVSILNESHNYSLKMGKGNSIHQEPLDEFLTFLKTDYALDTKNQEYLQQFIWADGTLNGTGEIKARLSSRTFKKQNPKKVKALQVYFNKIKKPLLRRFLLEGTKSSYSAEYLYHGTIKKGTLCKMEDVLTWLSKQSSKATLNIGKLSLQAWNRNLKGKPKAEKKRGIIQIKWGGLNKDIKKIAKVNLGKLQEIDFVKELNKKEKLSYWKTLGLMPKEHYAIRVKYQKYGKLNQRKVWAKADAFIVKGIVPQNYLKLNQYFLNEDDVKKFKLLPVKQTGISIKQATSSQYQILKIAPSTFEKLFDSNILAAGASMYYKKKKHLKYNEEILKAWGINKEDFFSYYSEQLNLPINSVSKINCQKCLKKIKRYANKAIARRIKEDKELSNFVFFGMGNFQEPFIATWLFEHGIFRKNSPMPFTVTTGSGRSKGKYSIVIKPK